METERRFRIPLDGSGGPSMAVNGYDHWLTELPTAANGRLKLTIHRILQQFWRNDRRSFPVSDAPPPTKSRKR